MTHMPSSSQSFQVTVPTRAAVEDVAWYGKPSSRPDEQSQWDVFSIATGPVPDDDVEWPCSAGHVASRAVRR